MNGQHDLFVEAELAAQTPDGAFAPKEIGEDVVAAMEPDEPPLTPKAAARIASPGGNAMPACDYRSRLLGAGNGNPIAGTAPDEWVPMVPIPPEPKAKPGPALFGTDLFGEPLGQRDHSTLGKAFLLPPFSVLNAREGWWQERKKAWIALGIKSEVGRGANTLGLSAECEEYRKSNGNYDKCGAVQPTGAGLTAGQEARRQAEKTARTEGSGGPGTLQAGYKNGKAIAGGGTGKNSAFMFRTEAGYRPLQEISETGEPPEGASGTSIFDPVICELAYRWFCPAGGTILDPFAGGSVRGIVAAQLGYRYYGIELRPEQVAANRQQVDAICPESPPVYAVGDSRVELANTPQADFLFSCPPYGDLEVYSDIPADLSAMPWNAFVDAYRAIIAKACERLKLNRFAAWCIGDFRGPDGCYRNFVGLTVEAFGAAGLRLYNEAILITAVGSLPIRVGKQFAGGRKLGKTHQNVLVFVKGDWKKAATACNAPVS